MYYILGILLAFVVIYIVTKIVGSLLRGCITVAILAAIVYLAILFIRSRENPVTILDYYVIDNYKVIKL